MTEKELQRLSELESKICPKHQVTEEQHKLAYARYVMEEIIEDALFILIDFVKRSVDPDNLKQNQWTHGWKSTEKLTEDAVKYAEKLDACLNGDDDKDIWERYDPNNNFRHMKDGIVNAYHVGDCTAFPATCVTCHAERIYGLNSSVNWSKQEGSRILNEYHILRRKQEEENKND